MAAGTQSGLPISHQCKLARLQARIYLFNSGRPGKCWSSKEPGGLQRALIMVKLGVVAGVALLCALFALKFTRVRTMLSPCC